MDILDIDNSFGKISFVTIKKIMHCNIFFASKTVNVIFASGLKLIFIKELSKPDPSA